MRSKLFHMREPQYFVETMQQASDVGVNPFALQLLAESFADEPARFGGENVVFLAHAHNGQEVWFVMTKQQPRRADFVDLAEIGTHAAHMSIEQFREWFKRKYSNDDTAPSGMDDGNRSAIPIPGSK